MPAFVTSELKTAFQIGFLIFLPFLVIDLVVASTLMSLGMMMLSPAIISMPFKLLLFVLVDGWALTMGSLAASLAGRIAMHRQRTPLVPSVVEGRWNAHDAPRLRSGRAERVWSA